MKRGITKTGIILLFAIIGIGVCKAQDPQYTQFYANQPMLNPAFTGAALGPRVSMNYRAQWVAISGSFRQTALGYDQPLLFGRSLQGVGILLQSDRAGEGNLTKLDALLNYSFAVSFGSQKNPQYLRFGVQGGIQQSSIDFAKLRFSDMIDDREGFIYQTSEVAANFSGGRITPDVTAGLVYYNEYVWAGLSAHHITQPRQVWGNGVLAPGIDPTLPMRITGTAGVKIPAGPPNDPDKIAISPGILFMKQRNFNQLNLGTYVNIDPMIFGIWYRTNYNNFNGDFITSDMVAALVGFKQGIFSIGYSYDYTISSLTTGISGGSHELAMVIEFERNKPSVFKHRKLPCPRF